MISIRVVELGERLTRDPPIERRHMIKSSSCQEIPRGRPEVRPPANPPVCVSGRVAFAGLVGKLRDPLDFSGELLGVADQPTSEPDR